MNNVIKLKWQCAKSKKTLGACATPKVNVFYFMPLWFSAAAYLWALAMCSAYVTAKS